MNNRGKKTSTDSYLHNNRAYLQKRPIAFGVLKTSKNDDKTVAPSVIKIPV